MIFLKDCFTNLVVPTPMSYLLEWMLLGSATRAEDGPTLDRIQEPASRWFVIVSLYLWRCFPSTGTASLVLMIPLCSFKMRLCFFLSGFQTHKLKSCISSLETACPLLPRNGFVIRSTSCRKDLSLVLVLHTMSYVARSLEPFSCKIWIPFTYKTLLLGKLLGILIKRNVASESSRMSLINISVALSSVFIIYMATWITQTDVIWTERHTIY